MTKAVNLAVLGNGPAFSAYRSGSNQTVVANTWTKLACNSEYFDTNTCFDTTLSRFTPTVAGYYQINGQIQMIGSSINANIAIYKNGTTYTYGSTTPTGSGASSQILLCSVLVQANGTTDYFELFGYSGGTSFAGDPLVSSFQAAMVRGS